MEIQGAGEYSPTFQCPDCKRRLAGEHKRGETPLYESRLWKDNNDRVVRFMDDITQKEDRLIMVLECSCCGTIYWFHALNETIKVAFLLGLLSKESFRDLERRGLVEKLELY